MPNLAELQKNFQAYILQQNRSIQEIIVNTNTVSADTRLEIYQNAYYSRLLESLIHDYPALYNLMGEEDFNQLGWDYIENFPSHFRSIRWFGKNLAGLMQNTNLYSDRPWLIEMAQFEWLLNDAFDAANSSIVTLEGMSNIPVADWPYLQFKIHPSMRKINLHWNTAYLWKIMHAEKNAAMPEKTAQEENWIIWRKGYDIQFSYLSKDEFYVLENMLFGKNFSEICEGLSEWIAEENIGLHAATVLKRFIIDEIVTDIQASSPRKRGSRNS